MSERDYKDPMHLDIILVKHDVAKLDRRVAGVEADVAWLKEGMALLLDRTADLPTLKEMVARHENDIELLKLVAKQQS